MRIPTRALPFVCGLALLSGCGGNTNTLEEVRYEDRVIELPGEDVENKVEYMPVDGDVLGFWVMDLDARCESACLNDHSPYGNSLYVGDMDYQPLKSAPTTAGGAFRDLMRLDGKVQASTVSDSVFDETLIGERFSVHLRARTESEALHTLLSLGSPSSTALSVQLARRSLLVELPQQKKRLLVALDDASTWQEIQLASDGERVTLQVGCKEVAAFDRRLGQPILSRAPTGAMVGARWGAPASDGFVGDVDVVRISRRNEANLFCAK